MSGVREGKQAPAGEATPAVPDAPTVANEAKRLARDYLDQDVERGLQAAAIASGNTRKASELLSRAGYRVVPHSTLYYWITTLHQTRYRELQQQMRNELNSRRADEHEALSQAYNELQWEILERLGGKLDAMKGGELAQAANKASIAAAVNVDKSRLYRSEPTEIRRDQSLAEMAKAMQERFPKVVTVNPTLLGEATEESEGEPRGTQP